MGPAESTSRLLPRGWGPLWPPAALPRCLPSAAWASVLLRSSASRDCHVKEAGAASKVPGIQGEGTLWAPRWIRGLGVKWLPGDIHTLIPRIGGHAREFSDVTELKTSALGGRPGLSGLGAMQSQGPQKREARRSEGKEEAEAGACHLKVEQGRR